MSTTSHTVSVYRTQRNSGGYVQDFAHYAENGVTSITAHIWGAGGGGGGGAHSKGWSFGDTHVRKGGGGG